MNGQMLAGVRNRQSWRPPAARAADALLTGIVNHFEPFARNAARLLAWHNQFTRRVRPWPGWSQSFEFREDELPAVGQTKTAAVRMIGADAADSTNKSSVAASTNKTPPPIVQRFAAVMHTLPSARQRRVHALAPRPKPVITIRRAMRITEAAPGNRAGSEKLSDRRTSVARSLWQPFFSAKTTEAGDLSNLQSRAMAPVAQKHIAWLPSLLANLAPIEPRLTRTVSSSPRHEVPGGFPTIKPSLPAMQETGRKTQDMTESLLWQRAETFLAQPTALVQHTQTHEDSSSPPFRREVPAQDSPLEREEAIEKLIQNTLLPVPLPGLELRLLPPGKQPPSIGPSSNADRGEQPEIGSRHETGSQHETGSRHETGTSPSPRLPPASPPAPALNINEVADKVYQTLMRRQQLERERKGLY